MMGALNRSGIPAFYSVEREAFMQHNARKSGYLANKKYWEVGEKNYMWNGFLATVPQHKCVKIAFKGIPYLTDGVDCKVIIMRRYTWDIEKSFRKAFPLKPDAFDKLYPNWPQEYKEQYDRAVEYLDRKQIPYREVWFDTLVNEPLREFKSLSGFIDIDPHEAAKEIDLEMVRFGKTPVLNKENRAITA